MASKSDKEYEEQILLWRTGKYDSLVRENGWLSLTGLFWLNEGRNLIGSNPMCEVILPERGPTFLGIIEKKGTIVRLLVAEGVQVKVNGRSVQRTILKSSKEAKPSFITWSESLRMVIHEHAGESAVRIWDNERSERFSLPPLKWFPINKHFRVNASYTRYKKPQSSNSADSLGESVDDRIDGFVKFRFEGKTYKLDVTETKDRTLFIKFRDQTTGIETYPPGRYYYTEKVKSGKVILDFNYSYSPPCAFTAYATCVFAPQQNTLPFRVEAGEIHRR